MISPHLLPLWPHLSPLSLTHCLSYLHTSLFLKYVKHSACLRAFALGFSLCLEDSSLDICMSSSLQLGLCSDVILSENSS